MHRVATNQSMHACTRNRHPMYKHTQTQMHVSCCPQKVICMRGCMNTSCSIAPLGGPSRRQVRVREPRLRAILNPPNALVVEVRLRLRQLVVVVWEAQVLPARVDIHARAEQRACHGAALYVPACTAMKQYCSYMCARMCMRLHVRLFACTSCMRELSLPSGQARINKQTHTLIQPHNTHTQNTPYTITQSLRQPCPFKQTHTRTCTHVHAHIHTHRYSHPPSFPAPSSTHTRTHTHTRMHIHTPQACPSALSKYTHTRTQQTAHPPTRPALPL